ncbi:hypothetical protein [Sphingosinicella humi]|uniref:Uncharacterized protein n=1 Tax=Allosphingosinicella humi TaxID=2068657 RepID=A0A2U2J5H5_9SPHN|nr:hypothetical protein [Sphingosinicella humi]PWG03589.1 hypothetical protein DF286_12425 [Sphingosinicella humi]
MKRWRTKLLLLGGAAALGLAIPAIGQEAPESLLPPGFGDPEALPPPVEQPPTPPPGTPPPTSDVPLVSSPSLAPGEEELQSLEEALDLPEPIEIPDASRRPVDIVGPLGPRAWGLGTGAFGDANGRYLSTLMRRLDAPLPSRWTSILLRRALLSRVPAPSHVHPVDWVAERAWLLLRMGEADGARMLTQAIDVDRFTPKMFAIAVQTSLAGADPAGLCPLIEPGRETSDEPVWVLGDAMCAALAGEPSRASELIDRARSRGRAGGIDVSLAEKVIGAGTNTRRAVTIEWENVDALNSWRFGLASATGIEVPDRLMNLAGPHVRAWKARAPMLPIDQRLQAADWAASLGVFSNASLVEMYSLIADTTDPSEITESVGGRLRQAYAAPTLQARMTAMRGLWTEAETPVQRHARRILTASAAARMTPNEALAGDAEDLIASMLTAGYDERAARWGNVVGAMDDAEADGAWALLAVASERPTVDISSGRIEAFLNRDDGEDRLKSKMLVAALAGLGRIEADGGLAGELDLQLGAENVWTRALDQAARSRQPGTVALLAGVGMQTGGWRGVPPEHLYRIVRALRQVGLDYYARMIAAEALARL